MPDPVAEHEELAPRFAALVCAVEVAEPEIVVPVQVDQLDARLAQPSQHREGVEAAARDRLAILEPEVEQIADDEQRFGATGKGVQEIVKTRGALRLAIGRCRAEM